MGNFWAGRVFERFARPPFVVEDFDEILEAGLLLQEVSGRGFGSFLFQGEVHAFVTAILLGDARLDALDVDAEPQPRQRRPAQVE